MKKLIVCDFDGTLYINKDERRLSSLISDIKSLPEEYVFAVASGRPYHLLKPYFKDCPDFYIISNDGALITKNDYILYENPIDKNLLLDICKDRSWCCYGECISYIYAADRAIDVKWRKMFSNHAVACDDILSIKENIYKIFFEERTDEVSGLKKCYDSYGVSEFVSEDTNKGKALLFLAETLGISVRDIIVFGDGENDIPMFNVAGRSYAHENAPIGVKKSADYIFLNKDLEKFFREDIRI